MDKIQEQAVSGFAAESDEVVKALERLNPKGKWFTLQTINQLSEIADYKQIEPQAWTGFLQGLKRDGNVLFPVWG